MIPRARKTEVVGFRDDVLVVRVAAPPVEGAANDAVIAFFATALRIPKRNIQIVSGERSRLKRVSIAGVAASDVRALA